MKGIPWMINADVWRGINSQLPLTFILKFLAAEPSCRRAAVQILMHQHLPVLFFSCSDPPIISCIIFHWICRLFWGWSLSIQDRKQGKPFLLTSNRFLLAVASFSSASFETLKSPHSVTEWSPLGPRLGIKAKMDSYMKELIKLIPSLGSIRGTCCGFQSWIISCRLVPFHKADRRSCKDVL